MAFQDALLATARFADPLDFNPEGLSRFQSHIDEGWIEEALHATGTATIRRRRLPAAQVIWLVIAMALFRNRAISEVVAKLNLARAGGRSTTVANSAVPKARARLGAPPVEYLFHRTGAYWADRSADANRWRGLAVYGIDVSKLNVPDSQENRDTFGGHSGGKRGDSGYPMIRIVGLMALRSHLLANASIGPYKGSSEASLTRELLPTIPDDSLSTLSEGGWRVRAIRYQRGGFLPQILLTSLLDPTAYPAAEIIALYHERWEIERGYGEIKTDMLSREEAIRSETAKGVRQEVWGILLAFNLVRLEMEQIADEAGVPPTRISFVTALNMIRDEWFWCAVAAAGAIPKHLRDLREDLKRFILPARRSERQYPRAVKIKMTNYARKLPTTTKGGLE
jgi:hypothetical protein